MRGDIIRTPATVTCRPVAVASAAVVTAHPVPAPPASLVAKGSTAQWVLDSISHPICSVDTELRYSAFNRAHAFTMRSLYGTQPRLGEPILELVTMEDDRELARTLMLEALAGRSGVTTVQAGRPGRGRRLELDVAPVRRAGRRVIGLSLIVRDVTERYEAEAHLKTLHDDLERLVSERCGELARLNNDLRRHAQGRRDDLAESAAGFRDMSDEALTSLGSLLSERHGALSDEQLSDVRGATAALRRILASAESLVRDQR